jgi:alginate O-acetyltransferase complex protein AlgI
MTFTSWPFLLFVAVTLALYYLPILQRWQIHILLLASLCFYGTLQPYGLVLLAAAIFGSYFFLGIAMARRDLWLPAGIAFNLGLLAFFKYNFLFADPATPSPSDIGALDFLLKLPLPIGISFYVLHNISLMVDLTSRGGATPRLKDVFLHIIFFPQLVAGPITRADHFMSQIRTKFVADVPFEEAAKWLISGYFFKLFVANNLNQITSNMDFPLYANLTATNRWICIFLYSYQIYADFFGYSTIAIGLALLFGYRLPINFNFPYLSVSFAEFWTRWHISLSTWLRTYLYIPLGGSRHGTARTYFNLMIVMALGGLWHGATIGYLAWGLLHGIFLAAERPLLPYINGLSYTTSLRFAVQAARTCLVFFCISMAWILFKLPNLEHAIDYLSGMFVEGDISHPFRLYRSLALLYALPVFLHVVPRPRESLEPYLFGAMATLMLVDAGPSSPFIYFQFWGDR